MKILSPSQAQVSKLPQTPVALDPPKRLVPGSQCRLERSPWPKHSDSGSDPNGSKWDNDGLCSRGNSHRTNVRQFCRAEEVVVEPGNMMMKEQCHEEAEEGLKMLTSI
ncbi:hypothetical protein Q5P01_004906 [Channa striata]|uniref:Uncharacterized protein n=1 Tax=Channa striata TaxID=64152 RepID=A0AA88NI70_CHASR|nr:hypothetical protein Q5P01_004906 [Channa striata]